MLIEELITYLDNEIFKEKTLNQQDHLRMIRNNQSDAYEKGFVDGYDYALVTIQDILDNYQIVE